jgi:hypothetical protein
MLRTLSKLTCLAEGFVRGCILIEGDYEVMLKFFKEILSFQLTWIGEYNLLVEVESLDMWLERFGGMFLVGA